jgi:hypothetical protein
LVILCSCLYYSRFLLPGLSIVVTVFSPLGLSVWLRLVSLSGFVLPAVSLSVWLLSLPGGLLVRVSLSVCGFRRLWRLRYRAFLLGLAVRLTRPIPFRFSLSLGGLRRPSSCALLRRYRKGRVVDCSYFFG